MNAMKRTVNYFTTEDQIGTKLTLAALWTVAHERTSYENISTWTITI